MGRPTKSSDDQAAKFQRRRSWKFLVFGFVSLLPGLTAALHFRNNFNVAVPGQVFRSGQLDPVTLEDFIKRYHFHTIINLRGAAPQSDWYVEERALARRYHIRYFDMPTDSASTLNNNELRQLLTILDEKEATPILIHCQSGIDRTGSMSVVCALLLESSQGLGKARSQLHWWYGNLPWFASTRKNLAFLDQYQQWLNQKRLDHSPTHFRHWALQTAQPPS